MLGALGLEQTSQPQACGGVELWPVCLSAVVLASGDLRLLELLPGTPTLSHFVITDQDVEQLLLGELETTSMYAAAMVAGGDRHVFAAAAAVRQLLLVWQMLQCWSNSLLQPAKQVHELVEQLDKSPGLNMHRLNMHRGNVEFQDPPTPKTALCRRLLHTFAGVLAAKAVTACSMPVWIRPRLSNEQLEKWQIMRQAVSSSRTGDTHLIDQLAFELIQRSLPLPRYVTARSASAMRVASGPSAPCTAAADSHRYLESVMQALLAV